MAAVGDLDEPNVSLWRFWQRTGCVSSLGWRNDPLHIPQILPILAVLPQKHLSLHQAAIAVDLGDGGHLFIREGCADGSLQIAQVVAAFGGHRDRRLAALDRPLDTYHCRVHLVSAGDLHDHRILGIHGVVGGAVAGGAAG